jgi:hypothetical protein
MEEQFEKAEFFDTPEQLAEAMAAETTEQPVEQPQQEDSYEQGGQFEEQPQQYEEQQYQQPQEGYQEEYDQGQFEQEIFTYLSERLGRDVNSFEDLSYTEQGEYQLDDRVRGIVEFVESTNRSPEDWFRYQSLDTSEMDDMTAIKVDMASQYPNLSYDEIEILVNDKYKINPDIYDDEQVRLASLQLKIDAQEARETIEEIRETYALPEESDYRDSIDDVINDDWIQTMARETDALEGLEFDLGNGRSFTFSLDNAYRESLIDRNVNLDQYFDPYVDEDGNWDFDTLNSHRALVDNIDAIISSAYNQGIGDGQRGLVNRAANVGVQNPQAQPTQQSPVAEQLKTIFSNNSNKMTFKI